MDRLAERLVSHPVHAELDALLSDVDGLSDEVREQIDATGTDGVPERTREVVAYAKGMLTAVRPELVPLALVNAIYATAQAARTAASQLAADPSQVANLDTALENLLANTLPLVGLLPAQADAADIISRDLAPAATERLRALEERASEVEEQLEALDTRRVQEAAEIGAADQARRDGLEASIAAIDQSVTTLQTQVQNLVSDFQQQFSQAQEDRRAEFNTSQTTLKQEGEAVIEKLEEDAAALSEKLTEQATDLNKRLAERGEEVLDSVQGMHDQVRDLYGVIGQKGTAGAFHDDAEAQKKEADRWRNLAIGFGIAASVVALVAVGAAWLDAGLSPAAVIAKVTATAAFAILAGYAARQSGHHRHREERERRLELELVAFEPFISSLEDDEKREARKAFLERFFTGQGVERPDGDPHQFGTVSPPGG